ADSDADRRDRLSGLHRGAQGERLSVAPHDGHGARWESARGANPHRGHAPRRGIRRRRALAIQGGTSSRPQIRGEDCLDSATAGLAERDVWNRPGVRRVAEVGRVSRPGVRLHPTRRAPRASRRVDPAGFRLSHSHRHGHRCVGAKVNGRLVSLDYQIRNGDILEIVTSKAPRGPSRDWLNPSLGYVKTAHAREKIRQWFKRQERAENIERGKDLIEKELSRLGLSHARIEDVLPHFKLERTDDLDAAVGCGEISAQTVAVRLAGGDAVPEEELPSAN